MEEYKQIKMLKEFEEKYTKRIYKLKNELAITEDLLKKTQEEISTFYRRDEKIKHEIKNKNALIKTIISIESTNTHHGAHLSKILENTNKRGIQEREVLHVLKDLTDKGDVFQPKSDYYKLTTMYTPE